jgi:hypothetical protein
VSGVPKGATTPIDILQMERQLRHHPDMELVKYLLHGLTYGFHTGVSKTDLGVYECRYLMTARWKNNFDSINTILASEVEKGYLAGPFPKPPFFNYRVSPIGLVEEKYSHKNV